MGIDFAAIAALEEWKGFYFRSKTSVKIAEALESANVLFYPNCKIRLCSPNGRETQEYDFLVCQQGKWGILQVCEEQWHIPHPG
uniref:Uncharacterized protein n=1 Tax=Desertifilum tharense IPPAS B-1220 TaxID=1781255 RepID=A0ACD5GXS4_9CYAN